ncbi:MAG: addiction module protein [Opitutaceae bacterium]|nr:addiction module protein [Opitutaceae bacterium]
MLTAELSRSTLKLPPAERLELARQLVESVAQSQPSLDALNEGVRRIEDVATGKVAGLTEEQYLSAAQCRRLRGNFSRPGHPIPARSR